MDEISSADLWEEVSCILCGPNSKNRVYWRDAEYGNIRRCTKCGLAYRSPRRTEDYYSRYFAEEWAESSALVKARTNILRSILKWTLKWHPLPGSILDIGSGRGSLLAQFPETWNRFGVDPSKSACQFAIKRLPNANIVNATFRTINLPEEFFHVITIIGTIYYLPQPLKDLEKIRDLLKPDGVVLIESPNFANRGYVYRWRNHRFAQTQMYFYTPKSIIKILSKLGMVCIDRIDLPGHRISSNNLSERIISWAEFLITKFPRKISLGLIDIVPRFVLVAKLRKSTPDKRDHCIDL